MTTKRITTGIVALTLSAALAGCVQDTAAPTASGAADLTGDPAAVAAVQAAVAKKGVALIAAPAARPDALKLFCSGSAGALALDGAMTDAEVISCSKMGGHWSALSTVGYAVYLGPSLRGQIDAFAQ